MRILRVIIYVFLGFFLILAVALIALPSLHNWMYPGFSKIRPRVSYAHGPTIPVAMSPAFQKIDKLGAAENIRTEVEAKAYVEAFIETWGKDKKDALPLRWFELTGDWTGFKDGLAQAEFAAVRDPQKLIPEAKVAETFNRLMDEWQMPAWTHASVEELHAMRMNYSYSVYPKSVARLPDKSVAPSCRPTEALWLLYYLNYGAGVPLECRREVRERHFPWNLLERLEWRRPPFDSLYVWASGMPVSQIGKRCWREYRFLEERYLTAHPEAANFQTLAKKIFSQLGIPVS